MKDNDLIVMAVIVIIVSAVVILVFRDVFETDEERKQNNHKIGITIALILILIAIPMSKTTFWAVVQVLLIFLGFTNSTIGMAVLLFDGYFHFRMGLGDSPHSPDWIIARRLFGFKGLPSWIHHGMGFALVLIVVTKYMGDRGKWGKLGELGQIAYDIVYPITAIIIIIAIGIKSTATAIPNNIDNLLRITHK